MRGPFVFAGAGLLTIRRQALLTVRSLDAESTWRPGRNVLVQRRRIHLEAWNRHVRDQQIEWCLEQAGAPQPRARRLKVGDRVDVS